MADLTTTIGGSTSNSYVSLDDFESYCDERLNVDVYYAADDDDRVRALLMAGRRLDRENWIGSPVTDTQALAWPRSDVPKRDAVRGYGLSYWGEEYSTTEIPLPIKRAQMELALNYLDGFDDGEEDAIQSFSADGVSVEFRGSRPSGSLPSTVSQLIGGLLRGNRLVRT